MAFILSDAQRKAARLAGTMYILTMVTANFTDFYVRRPLFIPADPAQTFGNISRSGVLVRAGIVSDLVTIAGSIILAVALYFILNAVSKSAAMVALFWSLLECTVAAFLTLNTLAALFLLSSGGPSGELKNGQLQTLAPVFMTVDRAANRIAAIFFGLGSVLFCYLWLKSRFIPRALAAWGILSSLLPILAPLATIMVPGFDVPLRRARSGIPITIFEVLLGFWLLLKGVPATEFKRGNMG
jgi:hypothetical protein